MQDKINEKTSIGVTGLSFSDTTCFDILRESESSKIKAYACFVKFENDIDDTNFNKLNYIVDLELN